MFSKLFSKTFLSAILLLSLTPAGAVPPPVITSFNPTTAGAGTTVNITGTNFTGTTLVSFGGTAAASFNIVSSTSITAVVGQGSCGSVMVTSPGGTTSLAGFIFISQNFPFGSPVNFTTGNVSPMSMATADFNEDGKPDAVIANRDNNNVSVLIGAGNGSFNSINNYPVGTEPHSVAVGDLNHDGHIDIVTANLTGGPGIGSVSVLLGNGTGGFGSQNIFATGGTSPRVLTLGDWNGDNNLDIAVVNQVSNTVGILLGTGTGAFGPASLMNVGNRPVYITSADFNNDGKADLVVSNRFDNNITILLGSGTGSFTFYNSFNTGSEPFEIAIGDINNDGHADLAVSNFVSNNVSVFLGTAGGSFVAQPLLPVSTGPRGIVLGDFDNDNKLDLAVANVGSATPSTIYLFKGNGTGSFCSHDIFNISSQAGFLIAGDFNIDNKKDIVMTKLDVSGAVLLNNFVPSVTFSGKVFLQGAYNTGTGAMNNVINTSGILQANAGTHPYNITGFDYAGTENVAGGFFAGHPEIVDWVLVELRDASIPATVVARRAAFLKQDGNLSETDGLNDHILFAGVSPGNYNVVIRHRNHLSILSSAIIDFNSGTGNYDFTTAITKAYAGSVSNPPMATLATDVYGMYAGNANVDLTIRKTGSAGTNDYSLLLSAVSGAAPPGPTGVYRKEDFNMDGNIRKTGSAGTNDYSRLLSILGTFNIITQPAF